MWVYFRLLGYRYLAPAAGDGGEGGGGDPGAGAEAVIPAAGGDDNDPILLMNALRSQRDLAAKSQKSLAEATTKLAEMQAQLEKYKAVDPEKYTQLLANQKKSEEQSLIEQNQWSVLKQQSEADVKEARESAAKYQADLDTLTIKGYIGKAFRLAGGIEDITPIEGIEQIDPVELLMSQLGPRIKIENGRVTLLDPMGQVEKDADGKPKTLGQKMIELKRGSFPNLFRADNNSSGSGSRTQMTNSAGKQLTVYTKTQARQGKADIGAIQRGEAVLIDG